MEVGSIALQNELDNLASAGRVGVISLATDFNIENDLRQLFPQNVASFTSRVRNYNPLTIDNLWQAMWSVLEKNGALGNDVGRMGHGLGMQLTEWPSHVPNGDVILKPGMVLTLEPGMAFAPNKMMVHEENIVITENGCELLHERTWKTLPVIV
ncbi:M24 family metallopeptidase [Vibrio jasicida]|uniref:M24 family metallopeptidase n=1 Tax=Vibrio jasicida TaxID=766224 RepID=UPI0003AB02DD|nr:M24 family metallopeptidase [Vibrio jasicida]